MAETLHCERCGAAFVRENPTGRRPRYCRKQCRQTASDQRTGYRRKRAYNRRVLNARPIIGVDSETVSDEDGFTRLTLIAASDGAFVEDEDIDTETALRFLLDRPGELWTFYGDYDVIQWLADVDPDALDRLRRTGWCYWRHWRIHHIPRRLFEIWDREQGRHAAVYDVWPFVQASFVRWLREWELAPEDVIERIEVMKGQRAHFSDVDDDLIRAYTFDEVRYIAEGVKALKSRIDTAGFRPSRWLGPGAVASVALRRHNVRSHYPESHALTGPAEQAYYGGRVETSVVGEVRTPVWYHDINSAYPAVAASLPCMAHGSWERAPEHRPGRVQLLKVRWDIGPSRWGPFPVRLAPGAPLRYPTVGEGWYWGSEVEPWADMVKVVRGWEWVQACDHRPMEWLADMYRQRRQLKDQGDPAEYALKLILNSCYGKLAQRVGTAPFYNPEWAGMITAGCRGRIGRVLRDHGESVLVTATDGILVAADIPLTDPDDPKRLGAWGPAEPFEWADVWQPGFYLLSDGKARTRGFSSRDIDPERFRETWRRLDIVGTVPVSQRRVIGYRLAMARNTPGDIGRWVETTSHVVFDPEPRRKLAEPWTTGDGHAYRTMAPGVDDDPAATAAFAASVIEQRRFADLWDDGEPLGYGKD